MSNPGHHRNPAIFAWRCSPVITRRTALALLCVSAAPARSQTVEAWAAKLIAAAEAQIGRTVIYDPSYVRFGYPGGDVPMERGVCTDVIIRAYREGLGIDLQKLVHEDMRAEFAAYPKNWGLAKPDSNIDHRRVPNLQTFFKRKGVERPISRQGSDYLPGDLVSMRLPGNLPHIALVSHHGSSERRLLIHNIGAGARLEDVLFSFPLTGHYRFSGA